MTAAWTAWWFVLGAAAALGVGIIFARLQIAHLGRQIRSLAVNGKLDPTKQDLVAFRAIYRDLRRIEARQRAIFQQIADEEFSLRAILSSMVEGVLIADADLRIRLTNQQLQTMFALPRLPIGRTVLEVFRHHRLHQVIQRTFQSEKPQFDELQMEVRENGVFVTKHLQITSVSLRPREQESVSGALVILHDVTQIRALEAVRKEFVANVSHELRTPLSILTGYIETLLGDRSDDVTTEKFLRIMRKHAERLNLLVSELLQLSRLESRRMPLHLEQVDVRECVLQVLERLDSTVRSVQAKVELNFPAGLPTIEVDALRLEQVFFNLLDNALKYGPRSGLVITVDARLIGSEMEISVIDNGSGIPLSDQPHIFERFYRVHKNRSRDVGGTGLGLSIVKHTVQAHGGSVALENAPGGLTKFSFRLPVKSLSLPEAG